MDGMAAARRIRERDDKVVIVFITAAPQYAISGYEVRALSYLLKPLPWFAFSQELKKSIDMVRRNDDDSMLIDTGKGQMRLNLADILYLESIRHTIVIHTLDGKLSINGTLKDMEAKLADYHFFRSNSCYLVNLKHVTGVADQDCIMSNGEQLRVSRPRKKAFLTLPIRAAADDHQASLRKYREYRRPMITSRRRGCPTFPVRIPPSANGLRAWCTSRYCTAACRCVVPSSSAQSVCRRSSPCSISTAVCRSGFGLWASCCSPSAACSWRSAPTACNCI